MEKIQNNQTREINKIAKIFADETSKKKGYFPKDKYFTLRDKFDMIKKVNVIVPTLSSVIKTPKVISKHDVSKVYKSSVTESEYLQLNNYIKNELGMDAWGVCEFNSTEIYQGNGIPYKNVIVMSRNMDEKKFEFNSLPNMDCQMEVLKIYGDTGIAALKVTELLRSLDYGAVPNHSLGGNVDYTKAGLKANLGFVGKHGMLITDKNGPCNRLSIVYTSIENLSDYLNNDVDHSWGYEFCAKCGKCVRECPYDAIYSESKVDEFGHVECISNEKCNSGFSYYGCGKCIGCCPFTTVGYDKLKSVYMKKEGRKNAN